MDFTQVRLVGFCGIIGVGKSTTLQQLKQHGVLDACLNNRVKCEYVQEPAALWKEKGWLQQYYEDQNANALSFQMLVFMSHVDVVRAAIATHREWLQSNHCHTLILLVERTMFDQLLFWQTQGNMHFASASSKMANEAYEEAWAKWCWFVPPVSLFVFFETSTLDKTMQRLKQRARSEEAGVAKEYQQMLLDKHKEWYTLPRARPPFARKEGIPCIHVDADRPFHENKNELEQLANRITQALNV